MDRQHITRPRGDQIRCYDSDYTVLDIAPRNYWLAKVLCIDGFSVSHTNGSLKCYGSSMAIQELDSLFYRQGQHPNQVNLSALSFWPKEEIERPRIFFYFDGTDSEVEVALLERNIPQLVVLLNQCKGFLYKAAETDESFCISNLDSKICRLFEILVSHSIAIPEEYLNSVFVPAVNEMQRRKQEQDLFEQKAANSILAILEIYSSHDHRSLSYIRDHRCGLSDEDSTFIKTFQPVINLLDEYSRFEEIYRPKFNLKDIVDRKLGGIDGILTHYKMPSVDEICTSLITIGNSETSSAIVLEKSSILWRTMTRIGLIPPDRLPPVTFFGESAPFPISTIMEELYSSKIPYIPYRISRDVKIGNVPNFTMGDINFNAQRDLSQVLGVPFCETFKALFEQKLPSFSSLSESGIEEKLLERKKALQSKLKNTRQNPHVVEHIICALEDWCRETVDSLGLPEFFTLPICR